MATTTPNFGWPVPTSTDLVKDGATAIESLGDSIDASLLDLKGGTSGQVLAKNSNTDMDFTWVAQDDSNAIQNTIVDAKGDLIGATAADTPARLAVGTNGQVLTADSTASTGLAWATVSSGGMTLISTTTLTGSSVTLSSIPGTYTDLQLVVEAFAPTPSAARLRVAPNNNTSSNDNVAIQYQGGTSASAEGYQGYIRTFSTVNIGGSGQFVWSFPRYASTSGRKTGFYAGGFLDGGGGNRTENGSIKYEVGAITSLVLSPDTGTFSSGTAYLYGVK